MLEEPSAKEMLNGVLGSFLPANVQVYYQVFEGKSDLEKRITLRLRHWQKPNSVFLVMRDKDAGDCKQIKQNLLAKVNTSGKIDKTKVRIACHELESFYLGDLFAVENGLKINRLGEKQNKSKFRTPDQLSNAAQELEKLTNFKYQKVEGSRLIGPHLSVDGSNRSHSFNVLISFCCKTTSITLCFL